METEIFTQIYNKKENVMFKNMKLGKKLITAFVMVTIISSISGILGAYLFAKTDNDYSYALENYGFASGKTGMLSSEINANRAYIRDVVFSPSAADRDKANAKIQEAIGTINGLLDEIRVTNTSDAAIELFKTIELEIADYRISRDKVLELGMAGDSDNAYALLMAEAGPKIDKIAEDIDRLMDLNFAAGETVSNDLTSFGGIMLTVIIAVIIIGFAIALVLAISIARGISRPVAEIEHAAVKMANGDYDITLSYTAQDEIGSLADSMRKMVSTTKEVILDTTRGLNELAIGNFDIELRANYIGVFKDIENSLHKIISDLSDTMSQIRMSTEQVSSGSDQVSSGAQALAQGATEQASSVEELSASINEVSDQIKSNAKHSAEASRLALIASDGLNSSNEQMTDMISAMSEISDSSTKIGKIIKTIEDIAFQTNILALNAAVEAARAGTAGKGFAVVADEVRNLANKSSEAAKQTNTLIEGSVKSVEHGVHIADETAKSLAGVVTQAQSMADLIQKISQASGEQSLSISQINLGVEQISSVVQTNSATSEESAAASEELNGQAVMMKELVNKFKLKQQ